MNPEVIKVKANPDFTLNVTFENGEQRIFDMKPYLPIGVFRQLREYSKFKKVKPFLGSIAWATEQDLSHDTLYLEGKKVKSKKYSISSSRLTIAAEPRVKYGKK